MEAMPVYEVSVNKLLQGKIFYIIESGEKMQKNIFRVRLFKRTGQFMLFLTIVVCFPALLTARKPLLDIMTDELQREMTELKNEEIPPFFMSYTISDVHRTTVRASFGALTSSNDSDSRILTVMVRVGDYQLDNTHELRDQYGFGGRYSYTPISLEDNDESIRTAIWQATNKNYREATERYIKVKTNVTIKVAEEDSSADFSSEQDIVTYFENPVDKKSLIGDKRIYEDKVKKFSALFLKDKNIYGGSASFNVTIERKNLVTSEGTKLSQNLTYASFSISGFIKSDDGMELPLYKNYFAYKPQDLPDDVVIMKDIKDIVGKLIQLRDAPVIEPYTGPAILSGRAAGVFFHEIFGHRIEGHRQKSESEGQTFKKHVGKKILAGHLDVIFDPTMKTYGDSKLMGYYLYDDEGVKAQTVTAVESGILRNFLMSRSPIDNFPRSNGHGRAQSGYNPVSRQSNLLVKTSRPVSDRELREKLIAECKKQGKDFGILLQDIQGGFTFTGRTMPNVFNLQPTEIYRIYTDGRPDELVRGVDLVGTPLVMFSMITDAGETDDIFNGICGAESGSVPVSAVSPSLFVSQVELQKKTKSQERPPILPRPDSGR